MEGCADFFDPLADKTKSAGTMVDDARRERECVATYDSFEVDQTQSLTDVVADQDEVWLEQSPALGAGSIKEL